MIAAEFDYAVAESVDDAIRLLGEGGADAKLLAGGHSLLPLMKLRFAAPSLLVDLRRVDELRGIADRRRLVRDRRADAPRRAAGPRGHGPDRRGGEQIADQQVRNRGTIGGSLVARRQRRGPARRCCWPTTARSIVQGPGRRARDRRGGPVRGLPDDGGRARARCSPQVRIPALAGYGYGYEKFNRRAEDWAMVGVCALVKKAADGVCEDVRIGLTHMASTPLRASAAEDALRGQPLDAEHIAAAAALAADGTEPDRATSTPRRSTSSTSRAC